MPSGRQPHPQLDPVARSSSGRPRHLWRVGDVYGAASLNATAPRDARPGLWQLSKYRTPRTAWFALLVALTVIIFWMPLSVLFRFSFEHEHYSHITLVPLITVTLLFLERGTIFARMETSWWTGVGLLVTGAGLYSLGKQVSSVGSQNDQLSTAMFAVVVMWIGIFTLCYGLRAFRRGLFPLLFLFMMVPIPDFLLNRITALLMAGSAEVSYVLLELTEVPFVRTGFVFSFPGFTIEIAQECSGIRSSLALLVTSLLAGHLLLRSFWTRIALVVATIPILIVKNGIRIATLSLLSVYVDPRFLTGSLHQQGGFVFFLIALMFLVPIVRLLRTLEAKPRIATVPVQE
jgi:exosortase